MSFNQGSCPFEAKPIFEAMENLEPGQNLGIKARQILMPGKVNGTRPDLVLEYAVRQVKLWIIFTAKNQHAENGFIKTWYSNKLNSQTLCILKNL